MINATDDDDPFDANGLLKDGRAVRISMAMRDAALADRRKVITRRDPKGREEGTWEEEDEDDIHDAMRDSARRGAGFLHDGRGGVPGHRPGFLLRADISNDQRRRADDAYRHDLENAWRNPVRAPGSHDAEARPPSGFGSHGSRGEREGDLCTVRGPEFVESFGSPGHLKMYQGKLVCVPDPEYRRGSDRPDPASDHRSVAKLLADKARIMAREYSLYDETTANRWRDPQ
jgi:hypothetical protein